VQVNYCKFNFANTSSSLSLSTSLAVVIRRRCQAKHLLDDLFERDRTYVPIAVSGTTEIRYFFAEQIEVATMLFSPINLRPMAIP
jgi:hypothetical protein